MKKKNITCEKAYNFAIKIVNLCREIADEQKEFVLTRQLL